ncbi:MAG TPA: glycerophosphodiester phosphodiesterase family protein, partial [Methylotenera sp.]|nr:glycerophosphodiester phosphodiesterase family protein [Methylotenera sp.]
GLGFALRLKCKKLQRLPTINLIWKISMQTNSDVASRLVAHRGFSSDYPENTLLSIERAFHAGAKYVEFDVQFSKDAIPIVVHDVNLARTSGQDIEISALNAADASRMSAAYKSKFGDKFLGLTIPTLAEVIDLFSLWRDRKLFLEIKRSGLKSLGNEIAINNILTVIESVLPDVTLISFDHTVLRYIKENTAARTGWVFEHWQPDTLDIALSLQPDYVFVDAECVPLSVNVLPRQQWKWAVYEIDDLDSVQHWVDKGADLVETNAIGHLIKQLYNKESR